MLIQIENGRVLDLDAPTLPAFEVVRRHAKARKRRRWLVWCDHCCDWHSHKPAEGHHKAGCTPEGWATIPSPYLATGYNLSCTEAMSIEAARREYRRRRNFAEPQRLHLGEMWTSKGWNESLTPHPRDLLADADVIEARAADTGETIVLHGHRLARLPLPQRATLTIEIDERDEIGEVLLMIDAVRGR